MLNRKTIEDCRAAQEYDVLTQVEAPGLCGHTQPCLYILPVHREGTNPEFMVGLDELNTEHTILTYTRQDGSVTISRSKFHETGYNRQIEAGIRAGTGLVLTGTPAELARIASRITGIIDPEHTPAVQTILCDIIHQDEMLAHGFDPFDL